MSGSFITVIYFQNDNGSTRTLCIESEYVMMKKRDNEQLKEYVNALFKDKVSL